MSPFPDACLMMLQMSQQIQYTSTICSTIRVVALWVINLNFTTEQFCMTFDYNASVQTLPIKVALKCILYLERQNLCPIKRFYCLILMIILLAVYSQASNCKVYAGTVRNPLFLQSK